MTEPFQFSNGQSARNGEDLVKLCQQFPDDAINYLVREDFEKWLTYIGETQFAQCAATARKIDSSDRQKLATFLNQCQTAAATPKAASAPSSAPPATSAVKTLASTNSENSDKVAETSTAAESSDESPKVSLFAIISQLIYNILSRKGRKNPNSLKRNE